MLLLALAECYKSELSQSIVKILTDCIPSLCEFVALYEFVMFGIWFYRDYIFVNVDDAPIISGILSTGIKPEFLR